MCVAENGCRGLDIYTALNEPVTTLQKLCCPPPPFWGGMVWSANYKLKHYPPEVVASIRLSRGQLMAAASPAGSCPLFCFLVLLLVCLYQKGVNIFLKPHPNSIFLQPRNLTILYFFFQTPHLSPLLLNPSLISHLCFLALSTMLPALSHFLLREGVNKAIRE